MPIGNKNENDGSPLNELSGLSISSEKGSSNSSDSSSNNTTSSTSEPYVPPSRRNKMSGSRDDNNSPYGGDNRPQHYNDNRGGSGGYSNDSPFSRKGGYDNRGPPQRRDDFRDNRDSYKSPSFSRNNNNNSSGGWENNNNNREPPRGGNYQYSPNSSFNRSGNSFGGNRGGSSFGKPANKNDRYYDRWMNFKDTRHFPDMKREIIDLEEEKAEEIFKPNGNVGIDFNSYDDDDISIETSEHICAPLISFTDVDLGDVILSNIKYAKYTKPTPVQKSALPIILKNRDLMACAQTGSGKTAAFLLPIISGILLDGAPEQPTQSYKPGVPRAAAPRALVLAPTRELAQQIYNEANKFSYGSPIQSVVIYGGAEVFNQINELDKGVDILVATTGRLVDLLLRGRVTLSKIKYLVLDEADRMLDMGFEPQIRQIIGDFDMPGSRERQTLMFSATFPKQIQALASDFLSNYIFLKVGVVGTTQNITQRIEYVSEDDKNSYLLDYISGLNTDGALTLIFVETKRSCDTLTFFLNNRGYPTTCIHGDLTQNERENALHSFSSFQTPFLVATDIASRGLHIPSVFVVINYDLPTDIDIYVHRIGRTGRAGKRGLAISFFNEKNKPVGADLLKLLKASNQEIPDWFEKMVHSLRLVKGPSSQKPKYESPFNNRSYNNHNRDDNRGGYNDNRGGNSGGNSGGGNRGNDRREEKSSNDYSMHHPYFNTGGSYN